MSMFDFSKAYLNDEYHSIGEEFDQLFLDWYDAGQPEHNFESNINQFLIYEFDAVDYIDDEPRRWSQWVEHIIKIKDRYFSVGYDRGLTELQEDDFCSSEIVEVEPIQVVKVVTEWKTKTIN